MIAGKKNAQAGRVPDLASHRAEEGPHASAAHGAESWQRYYSDYDQYQRGDLLDYDIWLSIKTELDRAAVFRGAVISLTAALATLCVVSLLTYWKIKLPIALFWSKEGAPGLIEKMSERWCTLIGGVTDDCNLSTALLASIASAVLLLVLSSAYWRKWGQMKGLLKHLKEITKDAKQIYPGSGKVRFSYGNEGLAVEGNNIKLNIGWDAIEGSLLLSRRTDIKKGLRKEEVVVEYWPPKATLLLIFLKATSGRLPKKKKLTLWGLTKEKLREEKVQAEEYIVVPKHFFDSFRGAVAWEDFCSNLSVVQGNYRHA